MQIPAQRFLKQARVCAAENETVFQYFELKAMAQEQRASPALFKLQTSEIRELRVLTNIIVSSNGNFELQADWRISADSMGEVRTFMSAPSKMELSMSHRLEETP